MTEIDVLPVEQAHQRELIEESAALEAMLQTPGWQVFTKYAEEWAREHEATILGGGLTDPLAYKTYTGRLFGIRQVLDIPRFVAHARDNAMNPPEQWADEFEVPLSAPTHPIDEGE